MIKKYRLPIGHLFTFFNISDEYEIPIAINRFLTIKTPDGFKKINFLIKKQGNIFKYTLENKIELLCDENHLVKDSDNNFRFIKDCDIIQTENGNKKVVNFEFIKFGDVFDIAIDAPHEYLTASGIICHNTTLAKILATNLNCDVKYINASDENSIDDVRTKVKGFASTTGFKELKILILDEADYLTPNAQAALRNLMETFSRDTRFILTCNYPEKIIDPIISRCQVFELIPPSKKEIAKHIATILSKESVKFEPTDLKFLIDAYYPDIRKMINNAQMQSIDGVLKVNQKSIIDADYKLKILEILKDKAKDKKSSFKEIRQILADNSISDFTDVYKLLYDAIDDFALGNIALVILILSEMEYKSAFVVDKEINFMSAIIQILDKIK
jgi:DNA polymerase III delta prime subunit